MKLNIQWKKVLYGIALIVIGIILAALHFYCGWKRYRILGSCLSSCWFCIQCVRRKRRIVTVIQ